MGVRSGPPPHSKNNAAPLQPNPLPQCESIISRQNVRTLHARARTSGASRSQQKLVRLYAAWSRAEKEEGRYMPAKTQTSSRGVQNPPQNLPNSTPVSTSLCTPLFFQAFSSPLSPILPVFAPCPTPRSSLTLTLLWTITQLRK